MAEYTKDEALTFIDAMRLTLNGKVGFKWLVEKLSDLTAYIESITTENERLNVSLGQAAIGDEEVRMISSAATVTELIAAYRNGPAILREAIAGMDSEALRARPIAGKMSSLEVLCHIVDSDQFMCDRIKRTIATEKPLLMGVESASYPGPLGYHERDPELDLRLLEAQREELAADLDRLTPDAWQRTAIHSENGLQTLREVFEHAVEHLEDHVATIADKRAALGL